VFLNDQQVTLCTGYDIDAGTVERHMDPQPVGIQDWVRETLKGTVRVEWIDETKVFQARPNHSVFVNDWRPPVGFEEPKVPPSKLRK
jgi:hypothetical protein